VRGDAVIRWGFWSQLVFLLMVDLGTIHAMRQGLVAWYHYIGLVVVNLVCLGAAFVMWRWLRDQRSPAGE
jgi:hypothetical protein